MSAHTRGGIAPEPSEPTIPRYLTPPALVELHRARPREGTVLGEALLRVLRERPHLGAARGGFNNKL